MKVIPENSVPWQDSMTDEEVGFRIPRSRACLPSVRYQWCAVGVIATAAIALTVFMLFYTGMPSSHGGSNVSTSA